MCTYLVSAGGGAVSHGGPLLGGWNDHGGGDSVAEC